MLNQQACPRTVRRRRFVPLSRASEPPGPARHSRPALPGRLRRTPVAPHGDGASAEPRPAPRNHRTKKHRPHRKSDADSACRRSTSCSPAVRYACCVVAAASVVHRSIASIHFRSTARAWARATAAGAARASQRLRTKSLPDYGPAA